MQLRVRAETEALSIDTRLAVDRKVRLALGRHAAGIGRAGVTLSGGGRARAAHRCRLRVLLRDGEDLSEEAHAEDAPSAAAAAARRLAHRLERRRAVHSMGWRAGLEETGS